MLFSGRNKIWSLFLVAVIMAVNISALHAYTHDDSDSQEEGCLTCILVMNEDFEGPMPSIENPNLGLFTWNHLEPTYHYLSRKQTKDPNSFFWSRPPPSC